MMFSVGVAVHVAPVRSKLSEEDEFALYAAKYEKKVMFKSRIEYDI